MAEQMNPPEGAKDDLHEIGEIVEVIEEDGVVEIIDIEIFAKERKKPHAKHYRFRIDREHFTVDHRLITGGKLFELAKKSPEQWRMHEKLHGGEMKEIKVHDEVDLGKPGIERFVTMELTQGDGEQEVATAPSPVSSEPAVRRQFRLPEDDEGYLNSLGLRWETLLENSVRWVLIHGHPLPPGYTVSAVTIAIRIEGGYPPAKLDMASFLPPLARTNGVPIVKPSLHTVDGSIYQQWSRHYSWREGIDTIATHHLHIKNWLDAETKR